MFNSIIVRLESTIKLLREVVLFLKEFDNPTGSTLDPITWSQHISHIFLSIGHEMFFLAKEIIITTMNL